MRIIIDLQGAQTSGSRYRGIGRYSTALTKAIIQNRGDHEILIALNGAFSDTIDPIRRELSSFIPQSNIHVWEPLHGVSQTDQNNTQRRIASEYARETFISNLNPDIIHISSLFEGFIDDAVASIGTIHGHIPTSVTLYDLIPLINKSPYLDNLVLERWYVNRLDHLRRADMLLSISESSRRESIDWLGFPSDWTVNVGTAADPQFYKHNLSELQALDLRKRYGLHSPFVMYTGGIDHRKNIEGLIKAYATLPLPLRRNHQLAITCSIQDADRKRLELLAIDYGIGNSELVMTGYVPESDLIALYSTCKLFVFPSWHEGFGLPALEAMRCGAPVIASNRSSLPEVIGYEAALFDPFDTEEMSSKIRQGLEDSDFRNDLIGHAKRQCEKFSWKESARRTLDAWEKLLARSNTATTPTSSMRPKLAYVSPLPPSKSGIADYSAELLPELSRYYSIDVVCKNAPEPANDFHTTLGIGHISLEEFKIAWRNYDRIVYHIGNSDHHDHMFELIRNTSGVVVLHDFFLGNIIAHQESHGGHPGFWWDALYSSHGYSALRFRKTSINEADAIWKYPCSRDVIEASNGVIVHSENSMRLAEHWFGGQLATKFDVVPLLRAPAHSAIRDDLRNNVGFSRDDFILCSFGLTGPTKLNLELLKAWDRTELSKSNNCHLVFVGDNESGPYGQELIEMIRNKRRGNSVQITGWVEKDKYCTYLSIADLAVQLRTLSRGETSAAALDCMNYGIPLIVNGNGSMADLPKEGAAILPDKFSTEQLADAIELLWRDDDKRNSQGLAGWQHIRDHHTPRISADLYYKNIEKYYNKSLVTDNFIEKISDIKLSNQEIYHIAQDVSRSLVCRDERIFIDISQLAITDAKTGIQRVVRSLVNEFIGIEENNVRIEFCFLCPENGTYRYARSFMMNFLNINQGNLVDEIVEFFPGDILLCLDLNPVAVKAHSSYLQMLRRHGIRLAFVVYDLIPIKLPHCFSPEIENYHKDWLDVVKESDQAICISKTVAEDLDTYFKKIGGDTFPEISHFCLGSNFDAEIIEPTQDARDALKTLLNGRPTFLMVGTIEPRKGHELLLNSFERLWADGLDWNLCIVGKQGWLVELLINRLQEISKCESRLIWLPNASDDMLAGLYRASSCLIAASLDEGFGLPLVEAAGFGLPIVARDIPVFREVCGDNASYFPTNPGTDIADFLLSWIADFEPGGSIQNSMPINKNWQDSANELLKILISPPKDAQNFKD